MKHQAPCPECGQLLFVDAPEDANEKELMQMARNACSCEGAQLERMRIRSGNKIKEFIEKEFPDDPEPGKIMMQAISTLQGGIYDKITLKRGRSTYNIDLDKDGFARARSKYTENTETKF